MTIDTCKVLLFVLTSFLLPLVSSCQPQETPYQPSQTKYYVSFHTPDELQAYFAWRPYKPPLISAHRGGPSAGYPENCLATFENSLGYAPCVIECDVRKSKDGMLLMRHDEKLERTTTGKGRVRDHLWEVLKLLYLKDNDGKVTEFRIPTFADTLEWARNRAVLTVDVKEPVTPEEIVDAIGRHKAEAYSVVITYNLKEAQRYHQLNNKLMLSVSINSREGLQRILDSGINLQKVVAFTGVSEPPREVYEELHKHKISAMLGVLGNLDQKAKAKGAKATEVYLKFIENGADILATNNVAIVAQAIQEWKRKQLLKEK